MSETDRRRISLLRVINDIIDLLPTKNIQITEEDAEKYKNPNIWISSCWKIEHPYINFERDVYGDNTQPLETFANEEEVYDILRTSCEIDPLNYALLLAGDGKLNTACLETLIFKKLSMLSIKFVTDNETKKYRDTIQTKWYDDDDDFNNDSNKDNYKLNKNLTKVIYKIVKYNYFIYETMFNERNKRKNKNRGVITDNSMLSCPNKSLGYNCGLTTSDFTLNVISAESW